MNIDYVDCVIKKSTTNKDSLYNDTNYIVWLRYPYAIANGTYFITYAEISSNGEFKNAYYPTSPVNKSNIISLDQIMKFILDSTRGTKRTSIHLNGCSLYYDRKIDCLVWKIYYIKKWNNLIISRKSRIRLIINANTGVVLEKTLFNVVY